MASRYLIRIAPSAGLAVIGLLSTAALASANTTTIGSALTETFDSNSCIAGCVAVQLSQAGGPALTP